MAYLDPHPCRLRLSCGIDVEQNELRLRMDAIEVVVLHSSARGVDRRSSLTALLIDH
jgi:hypothetical protein